MQRIRQEITKLVVRGHFRDNNKTGMIVRENIMQHIRQEITTTVVRGRFRDRNKAWKIAWDDSTQQIRLLQVTISVDTFVVTSNLGTK